MLKKLILSCVTVASIGLGFTSTVTAAEAQFYPGFGPGFLFGSPGYSGNGFYGDGYYGNRYYDDGYDDNGYYGGYHHVRRHGGYRCHIGTLRYHHRIHDARICNGHVTKVY